MDPLPAIGVVVASYGAWLLCVRRVRVIYGRRGGIERQVFASYDHRALARERALEVPPLAVGASRSPQVSWEERAATLTLGPLPEPWRGATWGHTQLQPDQLREARDMLVVGRVDEAASLAAGHPDAASLFTWGSLSRTFAGDLAMALAIARALPAAAPGAAPLGVRLAAQVLARIVEVTPPGPSRDAALREAVAATHAAGGAAADAPPALAGLYAHLRLLGLSLLALELTEVPVRRSLDRAVSRHPEVPCLHFVRAQLAAELGESDAAADHLTRALYYARGEAFYVRAVRSSAWLARHRPALFHGAAVDQDPLDG